VTVYEHVMVGTNLALASGLHHRFGWRLVVLAGVAAALPDWDGLSILLGSSAYAKAHRVWGHNLLVASLLGALAGTLDYVWDFSGRLLRLADRFGGPARPPKDTVRPEATAGAGLAWVLTGAVASLSHLPADMVYAKHPALAVWPIPLLWPFSERGWAYPIVPWGDIGATLIFITEMFALYRWPRQAQRIAGAALAALFGYVAIWWWTGAGAQ
jgi:hypothetical protein